MFSVTLSRLAVVGVLFVLSFGLSVGFWISADLGLDSDFNPNWIWVWVWVFIVGLGLGPQYIVRSESDPLPSLSDTVRLLLKTGVA